MLALPGQIPSAALAQQLRERWRAAETGDCGAGTTGASPGRERAASRPAQSNTRETPSYCFICWLLNVQVILVSQKQKIRSLSLLAVSGAGAGPGPTRFLTSLQLPGPHAPAACRSSKDVRGSFGAGKGYLQPGGCSQTLKRSSQARLLSWCCPAGRTVVALAGCPGKLLPHPAASTALARHRDGALRKPGARQELAGSSPSPARLRSRFAGSAARLWHHGTVGGRSSPGSITQRVQAPLLQCCRARNPWSLPANFTKPRGKFPVPSSQRRLFNQPPVIQFGHEPKPRLAFPAPLTAFLLVEAAAHVPPPRESPPRTATRGPGQATRARQRRSLEELFALCKVICSW